MISLTLNKKTDQKINNAQPSSWASSHLIRRTEFKAINKPKDFNMATFNARRFTAQAKAKLAQCLLLTSALSSALFGTQVYAAGNLEENSVAVSAGVATFKTDETITHHGCVSAGNQKKWSVNAEGSDLDNGLHKLIQIADVIGEPVEMISAENCSLASGIEQASNINIVYSQEDDQQNPKNAVVSSSLNFVARTQIELAEGVTEIPTVQFKLVGNGIDAGWVDAVNNDGVYTYNFGQLTSGVSFVLTTQATIDDEILPHVTYFTANGDGFSNSGAKIYQDANGNVYIELLETNTYLSLTDVAGVLTTTVVSAQDWNNLTLSSSENYTIKLSGYIGNNLVEIKVANLVSSEEIIIKQTSNGYFVKPSGTVLTTRLSHLSSFDSYTLSFTSTDPVLHTGNLPVYENGKVIGRTKDGRFTITGRAQGSYSYYVRNCNNFKCYPNSNTVSVEVVSAGTVLSASSASVVSTESYTLSYRTSDKEQVIGELPVYENNVDIGRTRNGMFTIKNKAVGSYEYYLKNCNSNGCYDDSNKITVNVGTPKTVLSTSNTTVPITDDITLSFTTSDSVHVSGQLPIYENDIYIGDTASGTKKLTNRVPGTYDYRLGNCSPSDCLPDSNTITITVYDNLSQGINSNYQKLVAGDNSFNIVDNVANTNDMLMIAPANTHGISVNRFSEFTVGEKLLVINSVDPTSNNYVPTKLIVIEADKLSLYHQIKFVGPPIDILFINTNADQILQCSNCQFSNFDRVSIALAQSSVGISTTMNAVGNLTTNTNGMIYLKNVEAKGITSLEVFANGINTSEAVNTNLTAEIDESTGKYTLANNGDKTAGSGGINLYAGNQQVVYSSLQVTGLGDNSENTNHATVIGGNLTSASISIISSRPVTVNADASLSTESDILVSAQYKGQFVAPLEGVSITTNNNSNVTLSDINILGSIISDNKVQIIGMNNVYLASTLSANDVSVFADGLLSNTGWIDGNTIELGPDVMSNRGMIDGTKVKIVAQQSVYNHFGGTIKASDAVIQSMSQAVINGSRSTFYSVDAAPAALSAEGQLQAETYGIYNNNDLSGQFLPENSGKNVSAKIQANSLTISAQRFENINPYFRERADADNWSDGVSLSVAQSRQVSVTAEHALNIKAADYVLNSSAILALDGAGLFVINSPQLLNERYRIDTQGYIYSRRIAVNDEEQGITYENSGTYAQGVGAAINAYSPMGMMYSFGTFHYSAGDTSNTTPAKLVNQFSFMQVLGETHFYNAHLHSIGLITDFTNVTSVHGVECVKNGCELSDYDSSLEHETLTSFEGNVYGINTDLEVNTQVQVENGTLQPLIDAYISNFIEQHTQEWPGVNNQGGGRQKVTNIEVVNNDYLSLSYQLCYRRINVSGTYRRLGISNTHCVIKTETVELSIFEKDLEKKAAENIIPGTNYTAEELTVAAREYLDSLRYPGVYIGEYTGEFYYRFVTWALSEDSSTIDIHYKKRHAADRVDLESAYTSGSYYEDGYITLSVEELMAE